MKDVSAADMAGDVFEEDERSAERQRAIINITSPSRERSRSSTDRARASSNDVGRSTSISSGLSGGPGSSNLQRRTTEDEGNRTRSIHRNRFFGRHRGADADVEMANIPENSRIDPRTGVVSPQAWRPSIDSVRERPDERTIASALREASAGDSASSRRL
jgi:hypothetical protein